MVLMSKGFVIAVPPGETELPAATVIALSLAQILCEPVHPRARCRPQARAARCLFRVQHLAGGAQSHFPKRCLVFAMECDQVAESIGAAGVHREQPKRPRMVVVVERTAACGSRILARLDKHALAGTFPDDLRSHHDESIATVRNLVASNLRLKVRILARGQLWR
jgi:hypothetical protein